MFGDFQKYLFPKSSAMWYVTHAFPFLPKPEFLYFKSARIQAQPKSGILSVSHPGFRFTSSGLACPFIDHI
jgi:hypothetical protein